MLKIENLHVSYGPIRALKGISLEVKEGEIVTLIGSNGAGKSTTLSAITGLVKSQSGSITFRDENITNMSPYKIVQRGVSLSPEGREVFPALTVEENLRLGAYTRKDKGAIDAAFNRVYELFPLEGAHQPDRGNAVRRRTADAGDRPRADERTEASAAG